MPTYRTTYLKDFALDCMRDAFRRLRGRDPSSDATLCRPDRPEHGDYSSNLAMVTARAEGTPSRELAVALVTELSANPEETGISRAEAAGPGFINLFLTPERIQSALTRILADGDDYGRHSQDVPLKQQVEFVSSNPTGPLTVGHGRQAVLGDVLARLLEWIGYDVHREYYYNDEGRQIDLLAESLWVRYREQFGEPHEIPEDGYRGDYLIPIAQQMKQNLRKHFPRFDAEARSIFREEAVRSMKEEITKDLDELGVPFNLWFSEADLHRAGKVDAALAALRERDGVYEEEGAVWLKAEEYGGVKDSVLQRSDEAKSYTYLMVDIAYHINKHDRGFDRVLNVQGADHHAEQSCMKAAMRILGYPEEFLDYAIHQFVSLKEGGEVLKMSTRAGRFVTLRELIEELGSDIVRWFMISRKPEAHLEFDLDLARTESQDNPATYVQYAHTRILSIFRKAADGGIANRDWSRVDLAPLVEPEEFDLIKQLDEFPEIVSIAATTFAPHLLAEYSLQLARTFHAYYDKHRVLGEAEEITLARLALLRGIQQVFAGCLRILGMSIPVTM